MGMEGGVFPLMRKLKLPVKALQLLLLIMVLGQQCRFGHGRQQRCFDPVWKTKVFNHDNGFVYVNKSNKQIYTNNNASSDLLKISTPLYIREGDAFHSRHAFYLFDPKSKRFLCWKAVNGSMTAMNYDFIQKRNLWNLCKFSDRIPKDERYSQTYVHLELAGHPGTTMQFDKKGRNIAHKRIKKCLLKRKSKFEIRHAKRCRGNNLFLLFNNDQQEDCCSEAYKALCKGKTALMPELSERCNDVRSCEKHW